VPRLLANASINLKLLVTPVLAILALAAVCGAALRGFDAERRAAALVADLEQHRLRAAAEAGDLAGELQTDMFRLIALGLMGTPRDRLQQIGDRITRTSRALESAIGELVGGDEDAASRGRLRDALAQYRMQSSNAVVNFLNSFGWGATTARNAAMALDWVIGEVSAQERAAQARVVEATAAAAALNEREKMTMLIVLAIGSPAMVLISLLLARDIAMPIRRLTAAMSALAERHYDVAIPAIAQTDEVGSMARAVQVFKEGMLRADALARQQQETQTFLDAVLEHVPAPILVKRASDLVFLHVNRAAETFLGESRRTLIGKHLRDFVPPEQAETILRHDIEALSGATTTRDEMVVFLNNALGERLATVTRLTIAGEDGAPRYLLTMMEDITARRQAERRAAYMAHYDALTDLPNRALFAERLDEALTAARFEEAQVAVLGLDLDGFKEVNDTLGHATGDALLKAVGQRLGQCVRRGDTVARLGGDEFCVVQSGVHAAADTEALAARLIEAVRAPFDLDGQQVFVGVSIGYAFSQVGLGAAGLVKRADVALYSAKASGRGRACCYAVDMEAAVQQRRALENDLRAAVAATQLTLHYQPQVDLRTFDILGAEVLLRWNRPGHGEVSPSEFIPIAEETGLIGPLGAWLLGTACAEAVHWPAHMHVAVNVSPAQLRVPGFTRVVRDALTRTGLDPSRLELEVTEGVLMHDNSETLQGFAELRALGVRLALDDFGTGYASLAYLQKFRFDKIKIDRSFVRGLATDPNASAIVRAVVGLSRALGMRTNAEGIETDEDVELLRAHGCTEAQGYRFWRAMPAEQMRALVCEAPAVELLAS
jgi:diguanylate cyclase (GGDEF)-like protein/PAS domain S-box-containing protein